MTLIEKIDYIINNTDYYIRHNFMEISEADIENNQFYFNNGDSENIEPFDEDDFQVYEVEKIPFPETVFELASLLKKGMSQAETSKASIFIEDEQNSYFLKSDFEEFSNFETIVEKYQDLEFFKFKDIKNFLSNEKNFKSV